MSKPPRDIFNSTNYAFQTDGTQYVGALCSCGGAYLETKDKVMSVYYQKNKTVGAFFKCTKCNRKIIILNDYTGMDWKVSLKNTFKNIGSFFGWGGLREASIIPQQPQDEIKTSPVR